MAEVLTAFSNPVSDELGSYYARAVGRHASDHMWEGWIEFVPVAAGRDVLVTGIESTQPEKSHLVYWATGLTPVYLEGALSRARKPLTVRVPVPVVDEPYSDGPAPKRMVVPRAISTPEPILDPFEVGERNIDILRQELTALNRPRLLNIISAYDLAGDENVSRMSDNQLVGLIVAGVERQTRYAR